MARPDPDPPIDPDPLRGGLKHNPFAALKASGTPSAPKVDPSPPPRSIPERAPPETAANPRPKPRSTTDGDPTLRIVVRREKKGRGGKAVTLAEGPGFTTHDMETLARDAARALGAGARVEDGALVVQGEQTERLIAWLRARGFSSVSRGN